MKISKKTFGILSNGEKVNLYVLKAGDLTLSLSTLGATWTALELPSRNGGKDDILLGYSSFDGWVRNKFYGVTVGRFANRIGGSKFTLDGKEYKLFKNNGEASLHGGRVGFSSRLWKAEAYEERDGVFVRFELKSPDGDEGYPGNLRAVVSYGLTKSNEVVADYGAKVDAPSPVNFTNHSYFNLAGEGSGKDVLSTELKLYCSSYIDVDEGLVPTGKILPVKGTPLDFTGKKTIGKDIAELAGTSAGGYDHCFKVDGEEGELRPCAEVFEPVTGRSMKVYTTQPGVQLFSMNGGANMPGKIGSMYGKHSAFCLETQHYPDSPNHANFPSTIFGQGKDYHEKAVFYFDW